MENNSQRLFELAERLESLKQEMKHVGEELAVVLGDLGIDTYHQDPETGLVYKVVEPTGTFVEFRKIGYLRTAKIGESSSGKLGKKEAQEQGFVLLGREG